MSVVTYDQIEPNIAEIDTDGSLVKVVWKCPVSGAIVDNSTSQMEVGATTQAVQRSVSKTARGEVVKFLVDTIGTVLGQGTVAAKVATSVVAPAAYSAVDKATGPRYTEPVRRAAVLKAFDQVRHKFDWDEDRGLFVKK